MKSNLIITLITLFIGVSSYAQKKITWVDLADVRFESKYYPEHDRYFLYPNFSEMIKALDGEKITISGFFLDIDPRGEVFVLSQGPMSSCFFCGVGGPETAMELHFAKPPKFKMDDIITVTGIFKLNSDDVDHFNYILNKCTATLAQ